MNRSVRARALLQLIDRYLREGASIEIDGLGSFKLDDSNQVIFEPNGRIPVFLAYAEEDRAEARRLYTVLQKAGFEPWMDREKLLPGQNWARAIERAIDISEFFIGCFSRRSAAKRGHFQCELEYALGVASRVPAEEIFFVPVRLDECRVPPHIEKKTQYVDLFPDWEYGVGQLLKAMWHQTLERGRKVTLR
ncbi:MAG: TIR domain-containing protein [Acidobacteriaceae bacterium]|nr:TIR domain-containing protein [Acidobacteriaceae bacterium]